MKKHYHSKLSPRLSFLSQLAYSYSGDIYDFCCDHGNLGLSLLNHDGIGHIYLYDQVQTIIDDLLIKTSDIPKGKITVSLKDCTKVEIENKNRKTIVIAGIGGRLSIRILNNIMPQLRDDDIIVLSPHNNLDFVRRSLLDLGIKVASEYLVEDNEKFYEIFIINKNKEMKLEVFGDFKDSEKSVKKKYLLESKEYFDLKLKYNNNEHYNEVLNLINKRLEKL